MGEEVGQGDRREGQLDATRFDLGDVEQLFHETLESGHLLVGHFQKLALLLVELRSHAFSEQRQAHAGPRQWRAKLVRHCGDELALEAIELFEAGDVAQHQQRQRRRIRAVDGSHRYEIVPPRSLGTQRELLAFMRMRPGLGTGPRVGPLREPWLLARLARGAQQPEDA